MLKTRIITAIALLAFFIPALFYLPSMVWAILMLVVASLAAYEWGILAKLRHQHALLYTLAFTLLIMSHLYVLSTDGFHVFSNKVPLVLAIASLFWVLLAPLWVARRFALSNKAIALFVGALVLTAFWMALVSARYMNPILLLVIAAIIWLADSMAYFAGKRFGKHKLAKHVSPGKTWEGVAGALVAVTIFSVLLKQFQVIETWLIVPAFWLIAIIGIYGDLFESLLKRQANKKDSGDILPGHGGILDRIDGLIPAMPLGMMLLYGYIYYFNTSPVLA